MCSNRFMLSCFEIILWLDFVNMLLVMFFASSRRISSIIIYHYLCIIYFPHDAQGPTRPARLPRARGFANLANGNYPDPIPIFWSCSPQCSPNVLVDARKYDHHPVTAMSTFVRWLQSKWAAIRFQWPIIGWRIWVVPKPRATSS